MKRSFWMRKIAGFVLMAAAAIMLFTFIVMTLWNSILAPVLNVHIIDFGQALGILILSKILFGGFRGGRWGGRGRYWNSEMRNKWQTMTPEEKEKFKQEWRNGCNRNYTSSNTDDTTSE
ncbi:MAG: hypothetical protein WKG06_23390 [Segetibacter sp.]